MKARRLINVINAVVILSILWVALPTLLQGATTTPTPTASTSGSITLYPASGNVGNTVQINGTNFTHNGTVSAIIFGSTNVTNGYSEIFGGEFTTTFVIPPLPKAAYSVTVTSNSGNTASASFSILPRISLDNSFGRAGDKIVVNGDGFAASSKVSIYFDYGATALATGATTTSGTISSLAATVPQTSAGGHMVRLVDASGNSVSTNYTIKPVINVDPVTVIPGSEAYISGSGFAPLSQISIDLDNRLITNYVNTDSQGALLKTKVVVPAVSSGTHILTVTDNSHNYAEFVVNASSSISVTPKGGLIGSQVTVNGSGFLPATQISLNYNTDETLFADSRVRTDGEGSFSLVFNIPITPAGTYYITATDGINTGIASFMAAASSGLEINSGIVGATIPVSGVGFTAGASINIKFDGVGIAKTSVDSNGSFSAAFQVPARGGGAHKIILTDGINPVSYTFTILPTAQISNSAGSGEQINGYLGSVITVSGNAFTPGAQVKIKYDSEEVAASTISANGAFSTDFKAPPGRPGKHSVTVSEGTNQFAFTFTMESTAPPVPTPISPIKDSQNEGLPKFQWSSVTDPSGVTYVLQVASDPSFSAPQIQKYELKTASYQLAAEELLKSSKKKSTLLLES